MREREEREGRMRGEREDERERGRMRERERGDNSDLEDLSDNDDPILDANYQPPPQEQSSSEDDSSDDEDPIPQPTEHSRGRKRLRGANNG
ncbi:hypothetical protein F7725_025853 [Dissostichus mawsoni]|uniref:Uncharacterized protein n=1 Tax=Dissostichus mawsoni TaxID=36200 RepID=A0A7J5X6U7_DISMA|nr:hypothetical protein F7725_025853 [Dissostichus mawsoni]